MDKNPKRKATLHSIIAGSIRPNARLARSHGFKPMCRCGAEKEDIQHVFNSCTDHSQIRDKYEALIQKAARQDGETQEQMLIVLQSKTFKNCGIAPECEKLNWQDAEDDKESDAADIPPLEELPPSKRLGEWWSGEWLRIFPDGGVADPDDHRIATGGCGVFLRPRTPTE